MTGHIWEQSLHNQITYARKFWEYGPSRISLAIYTEAERFTFPSDWNDLEKLSKNNYLIEDKPNKCWIINRDKFNYSNDYYTQNF